MTATLRTEKLSKQWGEFKANSDVSLTFTPGARHALIGPNGAGKTTFINLLTGVFAPTSGDVFLGDECITALPQFARVKRGMTRTFQINTLFPGLTVMESVVLAICERNDNGARWHRTVAHQREEIAEAEQLLGLLRLGADANTLTRNLPYGKQRLVEIALALGRARRRHPDRGKRRAVQRHRGLAARCHRGVHRARHGARIPLRGADHGAGRRQGVNGRGAGGDSERSARA